MSIELLLCPFCGGKAESDHHRGFCDLGGYRGDAVAIYCTRCAADMTLCRDDHPEYDAEGLMTILAESWNCRVTESEAPAKGPFAPQEATAKTTASAPTLTDS